MALSNLQIEKLSGRDNYNIWRFAVKTYLEHEDLWDCIENDNKAVDPKKDIKAKSKIILLVDPVNFVHIEEAKTARDVWLNLQKAFEDSGLSRKVGLLRDLINTSLDNSNNMEEYVNKILSTAHKLRNIGFKVDEEWLGTLMLAGLPESYRPMYLALEHSGITISSDLIKTKLLQEVKVSESSVFYAKNKNNKHSPHNNQQKPKGKGPRCYNCNQYGHYKNQCTAQKSTNKNENVFSAIFSAYSSVNDDDWYVDSGASMHISRRSDWMYDLKPPSIQTITVANNDVVSVQKMGNVNLTTVTCNDEHQIKVRDVLFIPELSTNLLSVSQLTKNGCKVQFTDTGCEIYNSEKRLVATARLINNMYKLNTIAGSAYASTVSESAASIELWHRRMGHLNMADVRRLENGADGVVINKNDKNVTCESCIEAKQTRFPFPNNGARAKALLEIVHSDLCGIMETSSLGGAKYFITFIDDFSRKVFVYFLSNKKDITSVFHRFKNEVENQLDKNIKILRTDNGTEYCNNIFKKYLADSGIVHQTTTPYTPEQNGVAERMNRTLVERAKSMLFDAKLSKGFWAEAVATAAYVVNRSPSRVLSECTPEEKWTGKKPNLSHLKIFGTKAMVHVPKQRRLKWDKKSSEMTFLGYCENTKGYRLYDKKNKKFVISRDVIFLESDNVMEITPQRSEHIPQLTSVEISSNTENVEIIPETVQTSIIEEADITLSPQSTCSYDSCVDDNDLTYIPDTSGDASDTFTRNITLRQHQRSYNVEQGSNFMCVARITDPTTVEEALLSPDAKHWQLAMDEEYKSLLTNCTWELTDLPPNKRAIPCKWVFKTKTNELGEIIKYKARLVIKGCAQKRGLEYNEVYSPVVRLTSLRYLFALAVKYNLNIYQMDAVSAFLQGNIEEEIYMTQPPKYQDGEQVCLLKKSLYGLRQASRQWNLKLDAALKEFGLLRSKLDPCIYFRITDNNNILFIATYVDDLVILSSTECLFHQIKEKLCHKFQMKYLGELDYCIGLHMERDRENGIIYLDQKKYIQEVLMKYGMTDCKPVKSPMDPNEKLKSTDESMKNIMNNIPYQEVIGCLLYISQGTRPDISYVINLLSKYNNKPEMQHWTALKRVMRYLKGTLDYKLTFKQSCDEKMTHAYCDSDWASAEDDRRSCTGYTFNFQGGSISWNSRRQPTVALSTTEAEYMALSSCIQEGLWLRQLQEEFWPALKVEPLVIYCDNQSCIKLSGTDTYHTRTKHIDVRHHFIRDKISNGLVDVRYIQTGEMVADVLTKPTTHSKLDYCSARMGLCLREDVGNKHKLSH